MRTMPTAGRIAIATLYLLHRDARRQAAKSRGQLGRDSVVTDMHRDKADAVWNTLQAVRANVVADVEGHRRSMPARDFLKAAAQRGRPAAMSKDTFAHLFADELVRLVRNDDDRPPMDRKRAFEMGSTTFDPFSTDAPEDVAMTFYLCGDR